MPNRSNESRTFFHLSPVKPFIISILNPFSIIKNRSKFCQIVRISPDKKIPRQKSILPECYIFHIFPKNVLMSRTLTMTLHNDKIMFSYPQNSFIKCFSAGKKWVHKPYTVGNENPLNAANRPTNQSPPLAIPITTRFLVYPIRTGNSITFS